MAIISRICSFHWCECTSHLSWPFSFSCPMLFAAEQIKVIVSLGRIRLGGVSGARLVSTSTCNGARISFVFSQVSSARYSVKWRILIQTHKASLGSCFPLDHSTSFRWICTVMSSCTTIQLRFGFVFRPLLLRGSRLSSVVAWENRSNSASPCDRNAR